MFSPEAKSAMAAARTEAILALRKADGNMILAADRVRMSVSQFHDALFLERSARIIARVIERTKERHDTVAHATRLLVKQTEDDINRKALMYKHEAMDVLREIAIQPLSENPYSNQVKLQAAMKLVDLPGVKLDKETTDNLAATLKMLNDDFEKNAPRLRVIRETVREMRFEGEPAIVDGRVLSPSEELDS